MNITTEMVKQLRDATACGMMDCKSALVEADGSYEKAVDILRERGLAKAAKRVDRQASEGVIEMYSHGNGRVGVMLELNCETDFVGRSPDFRALAHELALQIAAACPRYINEEDIPEADVEREKAIAETRAREDGKPEAMLARIVEGAITKFKDESVLVRQAYIRDASKTVQDMINEKVLSMGEKVIIRRFNRWELGEASGEADQPE